MQKLSLNLDSYYEYYDQIEETLIESGQIDAKDSNRDSIDTSDQER